MSHHDNLPPFGRTGTAAATGNRECGPVHTNAAVQCTTFGRTSGNVLA